MKKLLTLAMAAILGLSLLGLADTADAKRFGGGSSFGQQRMQPSYSQRQATPQQPAMANQRGASRPGFMGMLGGLVMGGLLGALLFGGAFNGINLFDILVIGGLIFLVIHFLRRSAAPREAMAWSGQAASGQSWESQQPTMRAVRPAIDEQHFLAAARDIFVRMQKAWDARDVADIRRFCTPAVADKIEQDMQMMADMRTHNEVGMLNAAIADSWVESDYEWAAVEFTAMLREQEIRADGSLAGEVAHEVNETWVFRHDPKSDDPTWYLAGIQQAHAI